MRLPLLVYCLLCALGARAVTADFTMSVSSGCAPLVVNFTDKSLGAVKWDWDFGNLNKSPFQNPSCAYTVGGVFTVTLVAYDGSGKTSTVSKIIKVYNPPTADFTPDTKGGCVPLPVTFTDMSKKGSNPIMSWLWDFGDGTQYTGPQPPAHYYTNPGKFNVSLMVTDSNGCMNTITRSGLIKVAPSPIFDFKASDSAKCAPPLKVSFKSKIKYPVGAPLTYLWSFGDKTSSTDPNPEHTYTTSGIFTVSLTVTDTAGCSFVKTKKEYIQLFKQNAYFTADYQPGCPTRTVYFNNQTNPTAKGMKWEWDFGDGFKSDSVDERHTYMQPGTYYPRLITTNLAGCQDTAYQTVVVFSGKEGERPDAHFEAYPTEGCSKDMTVFFKDVSYKYGPAADSCWWDFGDGSDPVPFSPNPKHRYREPGKYTVTLRASRGRCTDTVVMKEFINVLAPMARFTFFRRCDSDTIYVSDASIGADEYLYDFGDGYTTTTPSPFHVYTTPGPHCIRMRVYNRTTNCYDTLSQCVTFGDFSPALYASKIRGCIPLTVKFSAQSGVSDAQYNWHFSDQPGGPSGFSDQAWLEHTFDKAGVYTVKVEIKTPNGCYAVREVTITALGPVAKFHVSPQSGCTPLTVTLLDSSTSTVAIKTKEYYMGDGTILPVTSHRMTYTYKAPPEDQSEGYLIRQVITDIDGCADATDWKVHPSSPAPLLRVTRFPTCGAYKCWFDASVSGLGPFKYNWRTSDGTVSTKEIFEKFFTKDGVYTVYLTVTDANGCSDSTKVNVPIKLGGPKAKFSFSPKESTCPPLSVSFQDESVAGTTNIVKWEWDFGDGSPIATQRNPKHIYNIPGRFTVKLYVTDSVGCRDSFIQAAGIVVNGPRGSYKVSPKVGCVPLTVTFISESTESAGIVWDLGNGELDTNRTTTITYTRPGTYIPALLLKRGDCIYALPRKDTIIVAPMPKPDFTVSGKCSGYPTTFSPVASSTFGIIKTQSWDFGDGFVSADSIPEHIYEKPGLYTVNFFVSNTGGCQATMTKKVKIGGLDAQFKTSEHGACIGDPIQFTDQTIADTAIKNWEWDFGDGTFAISPNPVHKYKEKGLYRVRLRVTDYKGCFDTMLIPDFAVGDNTVPKEPFIHRVTVNDENKVLLEFSKHNDIDLAYYVIYRGGIDGFKAVDSVSSTGDTIYVDNTADAMSTSYCYRVQVKTFCNFISTSKQEHCSVNLQGTAAINSSVLNWNAYIGWEVDKYQVYREDINTPGAYRLIGTVEPYEFTFTDSMIVCYQTHKYRIKALKRGGVGYASWSNSVEVTPVYIPNVPANEVILATVENNHDVRVEWTNMPHVRVKYYVLEKSEDGIKYKKINGVFTADSKLYIDRKVDVAEQSYYYRTQVVDSCGDAGPYSNVARSILLKVDTTTDLYPHLYWTRYIHWPEGVKWYNVELKDANGVFGKIARVGASDSSYIDHQTDFNSLREYCYRITAYREDPPLNPAIVPGTISVSNEACVPARSMIYVPNVFTPNGDKVNDLFLAKGMYIEKFSMQIFDRWGARVFVSDKLIEGWDGRFKNAVPLLDAYRYLIVAKGADGRYHYISGWVTVMQ